MAEAIIGDECIVCGSDVNLDFHEIDNKPHNEQASDYQMNHPEDFLPLCRSHHGLIHKVGVINIGVD